MTVSPGHINRANMRAPTLHEITAPSKSRATTVDLSASELTALPHTLSTVVGRSATEPATIADLDHRVVVLLVDVDYVEIAKTGETRSISLNHSIGAVDAALSVGNHLWVALVAGDPTVDETALDLVTGPYTVVA